MSDPLPDRVPVDPPPQRASTWEGDPRTSYLPAFQVRMRETLHASLLEWAAEEEQPLADLVNAIIEDAATRRAGNQRG